MVGKSKSLLRNTPRTEWDRPPPLVYLLHKDAKVDGDVKAFIIIFDLFLFKKYKLTVSVLTSVLPSFRPTIIFE